MITRTVLAACFAALCATFATAQGLNEQFDTVTTTIPPTGWNMQNLSTPVGSQSQWFAGNAGVFTAHSGAEYIAANFNAVAGAATISAWLITPAVSLSNGGALTFYTRTVPTPGFPDRLQVRMNLTNTTDVGATATSVGDFTTLLLDINPTYTTSGYPNAWTQYTINLSGITGTVTGRFAFRYFVENGGPSGANSDYIGLDNVVYTPPATPTPEMDVARGGAVADGGTDTVTGASAGAATTLTYTITNTGTATLNITLPVAAPGTPSNCTASITTQPSATVTSGGGTTTLVVSVTPTAAGSFSCTISITNDDPDENPYNWTISGTATGPAPEMDVTRGATPVADGATGGSADALGNVPFGAAQTVTYTITNSGTAALNLTGTPNLVVVTAGANLTSVQVTTQPASTVAAAGTTTFVITYTVTAAAAFDFTVSIANNDSDENPYNWQASGTGISAPEMGVTRGSAIADGGTDNIGNSTVSTARTLTYVINNTGNAALMITTPVAISGTVNCTATVTTQPSGSVAAAGSTNLVINVTPSGTGSFSFAVSVVNNDSDENPYNWTVTGTGTTGTTGSGGGGGGGDGGGCSTNGQSWSLVLLAALVCIAAVALRRKKLA